MTNLFLPWWHCNFDPNKAQARARRLRGEDKDKVRTWKLEVEIVKETSKQLPPLQNRNLSTAISTTSTSYLLIDSFETRDSILFDVGKVENWSERGSSFNVASPREQDWRQRIGNFFLWSHKASGGETYHGTDLEVKRQRKGKQPHLMFEISS